MPSKYRYNRYRDLEINVACIATPSTNVKDLADIIKKEYDRWAARLSKSRERFTAVMWLNLPKSLVQFTSCLVEDPLNFSMHHATSSRVMLVKTHPESRGRTEIPSYGTHYVKVECVVVEDETQRVLMVRDRICTSRALQEVAGTHEWQKDSALKLVSGSCETGEFFADAAVREVKEETDVCARFACLIGCGNRLKTRFDRDEVVMACLLYAERGQTPRADGSEVSHAIWCNAEEASEKCTPMSREWLAAAHACKPDYAERLRTEDLFRGKPHFMDFYVPRLRTKPY